MPKKNPGGKALEGLKVADFTWVLAGPKTTKTFSDHGATVIKIEGRSRLDHRRITSPYKDGVPGVNRSGRFAQTGTGKLSVALNLGHPKGREVAKRIVAWADVVVENFAGGVMERMGLGYEELKKVKPDIIMLRSSMMGQTGPYATYSGFGNQLAALSGFNSIAGWPDRLPAGLEAYTDFIAPHFGALAVIAASLYRQRTGKGQYLDQSQYEGGMHFMAPLILDSQ